MNHSNGCTFSMEHFFDISILCRGGEILWPFVYSRFQKTKTYMSISFANCIHLLNQVTERKINVTLMAEEQAGIT